MLTFFEVRPPISTEHHSREALPRHADRRDWPSLIQPQLSQQTKKRVVFNSALSPGATSVATGPPITRGGGCSHLLAIQSNRAVRSRGRLQAQWDTVVAFSLTPSGERADWSGIGGNRPVITHHVTMPAEHRGLRAWMSHARILIGRATRRPLQATGTIVPHYLLQPASPPEPPRLAATLVSRTTNCDSFDRPHLTSSTRERQPHREPPTPPPAP